MSKNLVYTVAYDEKNSVAFRKMAKMLASSLIRCGFSGDIIIFHNGETAIFEIERRSILEIPITLSDFDNLRPIELKFSVGNMIPDLEQYEKVMFIDSDCLAFRNIDHLLEGNWDIAYQTEPGMPITHSQFNSYLTDSEMSSLWLDGINSGTFAISASVFRSVMSEWQRINDSTPLRLPKEHDQPAWNRVVIDTSLCKTHFPFGEIQFPMLFHPRFHRYREAALLHMVGGLPEDKVRFTFGLYITRFLADRNLQFLDVIDI